MKQTNYRDSRPYQAYYYASARPQRATPPPKPPRRHHFGRRLKFLLIVVIVAGVIHVVIDKYHTTSTTSPGSSSGAKTASKPQPAGPSRAVLATMGQSINAVIDQHSGIDISVNLIDLNNNQAQSYGAQETYLAASTAKIITAEYFLHQVEAGHESLSETINGNTAKYEMQQMIVVSDDNAWDALNNELGYTNLQNYAANSLGITDYQAYNNVLSSGDIALALQKLWTGGLLNSTDTQLLLSYMKQANYRQYIVPAVPVEDTIYHKIGFYEDYVHDAAIITHGQQAFVIVIFTNGHGTGDWTQRATIMQDITKAALKAYFNQ